MILSLILLGSIIQVSGHARLDFPVPWNPNPSKTFECGGVTAYQAGTPVYNLSVGQTVIIYLIFTSMLMVDGG